MAKGKQTSSRVVEMVGPDTRMDEGANPLQIKCPHCTMPDLDFVPSTYLLARGFASPAETAPAEVGNFLVRDRVRKILEFVVPGACRFVPTAEKKSKKPTDWWLAVPTRTVEMPGLPERSKGRERCKKCGEPKLGYYPHAPVEGNPRKYRNLGLEKCDCGGLDVFKSGYWQALDTAEHFFEEAVKYTPKGGKPPEWSTFGRRYGVLEPPAHRQRWTRFRLSRDLFFSVRLEQLLRKAKVKGQLVRGADDDLEATPEDLGWIKEKLQLLSDAGLTAGKSATAKTKATSATNSWFQQYLKTKKSKKKPAKVDFAAIEAKQKFTFPSDYKEFAMAIGSASFKDVMGMDGFTAKVLAPEKLNFTDYRRGAWKKLEVESKVDGIGFAETTNGDVFIFDRAAGPDGICTVYWYDHEQNTMEPFAASFADCIKRFDQRN